MRHLVHGRKLNVDSQHRLALRRNLARGLFLRGRIVTTTAKAKAVRPFVEKLVTRAKHAVDLQSKDRAAYVHQLRVLARDVPDRAVLKLLVTKIAPMCKDRPGGYTRILRDAVNQVGDNAPRAIFEFVDRPPAEGETGAPSAEAAAGDEKAKKSAPKTKKGGSSKKQEKAKAAASA
jgi:large subunit ribosomal protein L17